MVRLLFLFAGCLVIRLLHVSAQILTALNHQWRSTENLGGVGRFVTGNTLGGTSCALCQALSQAASGRKALSCSTSQIIR